LNGILRGQVIAAFSRQYLVRLENSVELTCLTRGKKSEVVCGDRVEIKLTGSQTAEETAQGVIENILPRSSLLYRSDTFREKLIAANVTQIIVVVAAEPSFSDELLARCLVAAYDQKIGVLIVLNKCDLADAASAARKRLDPYRAIGYRILEICAKEEQQSALDRAENVDSLRPFLSGQASVLVGQSGMGKSTIINALLPGSRAATREISTALDSGKHTTTYARLYRLDNDSSLIDCPGVQVFGLSHLSFGAIEEGFVEFEKYRGRCRFHDCHHTHEPDCALRKAVSSGEISARRFELFQQITAKSS
jgi:ribosome biogenesis GTPase